MANVGNERMMEVMMGTHMGHAACAVAELGIANLIPRGASRPVSELASEAGCDAAHLYRTLRLLASYGFFQETASHSFALTPTAEAMRDDAPQSTRAGWRMIGRILAPTVRGLQDGLRTGGTPLTVGLGRPLFDFLMSSPDDAALFDAGMTAIHGPETDAMLVVFDFGGIATLADIGGGNGSLLCMVLQRYPQMLGLLFDRPYVMERAKSSLELAGLAGRCRLESGDFFEAIPSGADAYLFRHIIHDWTDEQSTAILANCRKVMPANGRLLLVEAVVPSDNDRSMAKDFDFAMLLYTGGWERTEEEYRDLFRSAGFALKGITPTASPVSVIEGRPV
jgi:hypothetical protein